MAWTIRTANAGWISARKGVLNSPSFRRFAGANGDVERWSQWLRDPLSHPDLQAMSPTQLADLPFDPKRIKPE